MELLKKQTHEKITPEIRRELTHAVSREAVEEIALKNRVETDNPDMQV